MAEVQVLGVQLRDFRTYARAEASFGPGLTVVYGPNGAGKSNLLEALYFGCTGRSCRTTNEREVVRFGERATRVVVAAEAEDGAHEISVGFAPGEPKRMKVDGACHCGAVRCEADINTDYVVLCHCTDCQTFSSAPYRASVPVKARKPRCGSIAAGAQGARRVVLEVRADL